MPLTTWLGYAALAFWLWLLAASLAEAEGFAGTGRVAAVLAAGVRGGRRRLGLLAAAALRRADGGGPDARRGGRHVG